MRRWTRRAGLQFAAEGAVLEGGEEGVEPSQRILLDASKSFACQNVIGKVALDSHGRQRNFKTLNDARVQIG